MKEFKPGDEYVVYVNGRREAAHIDCHGTARFDEDPSVTYRGVPVNAHPGSGPGQMDWNALAYDRNVSEEDRIRMHIASGYSVSGFCDCNLRVKVETPEWSWNAMEGEDLIAELESLASRTFDDPELESVLDRAIEFIRDHID